MSGNRLVRNPSGRIVAIPDTEDMIRSALQQGCALIAEETRNASVEALQEDSEIHAPFEFFAPFEEILEACRDGETAEEICALAQEVGGHESFSLADAEQFIIYRAARNAESLRTKEFEEEPAKGEEKSPQETPKTKQPPKKTARKKS